MTTCWACETALRPEWKFCIHCGVPVEDDAVAAAARADADQINPLAIFGWIFASVAAAVIVTGVILFLLAR